MAQVAARQVPAWQTLLLHSVPVVQGSPMAAPQALQLPPQSTPVSSPFIMPSLQLGAAPHVPFVQTLPVQSLLTAQEDPSAQASQSLPPQSVSVSPALLKASPQVAKRHVPPWQTSLLQSASMVQVPPMQAPQLPPQSTPVSEPFITVSVQVAAEQVFVPPSHTSLVQSVPIRHI